MYVQLHLERDEELGVDLAGFRRRDVGVRRLDVGEHLAAIEQREVVDLEAGVVAPRRSKVDDVVLLTQALAGALGLPGAHAHVRNERGARLAYAVVRRANAVARDDVRDVPVTRQPNRFGERDRMQRRIRHLLRAQHDAARPAERSICGTCSLRLLLYFRVTAGFVVGDSLVVLLQLLSREHAFGPAP